MTGWLHLFAVAALAPVMLGAPQPAGDHLTLALCSNGALVTIEIPRDQVPPTDRSCSEGCHSGCSRKRIDRAQ